MIGYAVKRFAPKGVLPSKRVALLLSQMDAFHSKCQSLGLRSRCMSYLNPTVNRRHVALALQHTPDKEDLRALRREPIRAAVEAMRAHASSSVERQYKVVDAQRITALRWEASHDGVHYTVSCKCRGARNLHRIPTATPFAIEYIAQAARLLNLLPLPNLAH